MPTPTLHIQLLGDFRLTLDNTLITSVNSTRHQSLLAYLLLHRDAPQLRSHLAFILWPDSTETNARNNFRQILFELRRALPPIEHFLNIDNLTVLWRNDSPLALDLDTFQRSLADAAQQSDAAHRRGALVNAIEIYRGDLLPGCYDEWLTLTREQLRGEVLVALEQLVELETDAHNLTAAIQHCQRLLQYNPLQETTYRRLMRLHTSTGDRASALLVYHSCVTILKRELDVDPSPETQKEYTQLLNLSAPRPPLPETLPVAARLVGRKREWARLHNNWRAVVEGKPHFVLIEGEAGIGKTYLAEEWLAWAKRQNIATASARCYAAEGAIVFAPITTWLRARELSQLEDIHLVEIAHLLPEIQSRRPDLQITPLTESWQRQRLFEGLARAILGGRQPLILLLDDLQWCDRDTLDWLHYLLRFDSHAPLLIIATLRSEEFDPADSILAFLSSLTKADQLTRIELSPLDEAETSVLGSNVAGFTLDAPVAQQLFRETEGNPLFVVETVRARLLDTSAGETPIPSKVQAVILARVKQLSPPARELLNVAAIIGREFSFEVLAHAGNLDEDYLVRSLDELWQRRIVREHGAHTYDFSHDKLRQVTLTRISPARRLQLERRVARSLETVHASNLDAVSAQIAAHYERAGNAEAAIRSWDHAARAARQIYAHAQAIDDYRRAIALVSRETPSDLAVGLYENLGDLCLWIAQYDQARNAYQSVLDLVADSITRARTHRKIGNTFREQYHYQEALQAYAQANHVLNQTTSNQSPEWWYEWIQTQLEIGLVYYWLGQTENSERLNEILEPTIARYGAPTQRALFFQRIAATEFVRNRWISTPKVIALGKAAVIAYKEAQNWVALPAAEFALGMQILWSNDPDTAIELLESVLHQSEQRGDTSLQARCLTYLTIAYRKIDQLEKTQQLATRSLQLATAVNMPEYIGTAKANLAWCALRKSNFKSAQTFARDALESWSVLPAAHASTPFRWLALFPLIATELEAKHIEVAISYAHVMLEPSQQRLPEPLSVILKQALRNWEAGKSELAHDLLHHSILLAREQKYL